MVFLLFTKRINDKFLEIMVDIAESRTNEWFQVTENLEKWENQIKKLKEDLSELSDDELIFNTTEAQRVEEVILNKV